MVPRSKHRLRTVLIAEAEDFLEFGKETEGRNRGPTVDWFLRGAGRDPRDAEEWCAAFVNRVAEIGCAKKNVRSPLELVPLQAYVKSYYDYGEAHGWIVEEPAFGDLFLVWHNGLRRYAHMGWVADPHHIAGRFLTVEGNSNDDESRVGHEVAQNARPYSPGIVFLNPWRGLDP